MRKPVFGVSDQVLHKPGCTTTHKMARGLKFSIKEVEGLYYVGKTKALISFAVTAKLICVFVFAYAKKPVFSRHGSFYTVMAQSKAILCCIVVVVVELMLYVHGKQLRLCPDGQLSNPHCSWACLPETGYQYLAHIFSPLVVCAVLTQSSAHVGILVSLHEPS